MMRNVKKALKERRKKVRKTTIRRKKAKEERATKNKGEKKNYNELSFSAALSGFENKEQVRENTFNEAHGVDKDNPPEGVSWM